MGLFKKNPDNDRKKRIDKIVEEALSGPPSTVFPDKGKVRPGSGKPPRGFREIKCPYCKNGWDKKRPNLLCAICDGESKLWVGK